MRADADADKFRQAAHKLLTFPAKVPFTICQMSYTCFAESQEMGKSCTNPQYL